MKPHEVHMPSFIGMKSKMILAMLVAGTMYWTISLQRNHEFVITNARSVSNTTLTDDTSATTIGNPSSGQKTNDSVSAVFPESNREKR